MGMDAAMGAAGGGGAAGIVDVLKYVMITLGGGVLLGAVCGLVFAGLKYPNPNKKALFSTKQKIVMLTVAVLGIAMVIFAFTKKPGGEKPTGGDMEMSQAVDADGNPEGAQPEGEGEGASDEASSGGEATDGESTESSEGEAESSESSESSSSSSSSSSAAAPAGGGSVAIGGGGGVIHFAGGGGAAVRMR